MTLTMSDDRIVALEKELAESKAALAARESMPLARRAVRLEAGFRAITARCAVLEALLERLHPGLNSFVSEIRAALAHDKVKPAEFDEKRTDSSPGPGGM